MGKCLLPLELEQQEEMHLTTPRVSRKERSLSQLHLTSTSAWLFSSSHALLGAPRTPPRSRPALWTFLYQHLAIEASTKLLLYSDRNTEALCTCLPRPSIEKHPLATLLSGDGPFNIAAKIPKMSGKFCSISWITQKFFFTSQANGFPPRKIENFIIGDAPRLSTIFPLTLATFSINCKSQILCCDFGGNLFRCAEKCNFSPPQHCRRTNDPSRAEIFNLTENREFLSPFPYFEITRLLWHTVCK